jgi:epoxyqueuosine reductase
VTMMPEGKELALYWEEAIGKFVRESPENCLKNSTNEPAWPDPPLIGFSKGEDPLYDAFKTYVGPFHWTPAEVFSLAFPDSAVSPSDLTVISWVLPQSEATRTENRKENIFPSERWARARVYGEEFNQLLRRHLVEALARFGIRAVAPQLFSEWRRKSSDRFGFSSTWSERHAAFASGLGTFGLCDGLITARGKAMRLGSVVAALRIPPTERPYDDYRAYCLFFSHGSCGKCIRRCPVGALNENGHDKVKCSAHLNPTSREHVKTYYGFDGYACGLCQTGVPCESRIPFPSDG